MKLISELIKQINIYKSQIILRVFPIYMQLKQDTLIPGKNYNVSENFRLYKDEKSIMKE